MGTDGTRVESFRCQNCGGAIQYDIAKQEFCCQSCGAPAPEHGRGEPVREHPIEGYALREREGAPFRQTQDAVCATCGARIVFEENQTATVCPMCGSSQVAVEQLREGVPPDGVITFQIDRHQAQENFKRWVKKRWFAPNRFKQAYQEGKLSGVFLPFWTYDADVQATYTGQGGRHYTVKDKDGKTHTETRWSFVSGHVGGSYDDIQVCASNGAAASTVGKIMPYNTSGNTRPYAPAYLAGFSAERYARHADDAFADARAVVLRDLESRAEREILAGGFDVANVTNLDAQFTNVRYKHVLLPAWLSAFFYSGKQYLYMINGETGRVGGQRPYSVPKIAAAVLAVLAIVLLVFLISERAGAAAPEWETVYMQQAAPVREDDLTSGIPDATADGGLEQHAFILETSCGRSVPQAILIFPAGNPRGGSVKAA